MHLVGFCEAIKKGSHTRLPFMDLDLCILLHYTSDYLFPYLLPTSPSKSCCAVVRSEYLGTLQFLKASLQRMLCQDTARPLCPLCLHWALPVGCGDFPASFSVSPS